MKLNLILAALSLVSASFTPSSNGLPPARIVGGHEVNPKFAYPWVVSLQYKNQHWCGGTLANGNTIITAAHCIVGSDSDWTASIHRHNLKLTPEEEEGNTYKVVQRIPHPQYNKATKSNDVAIWKIDAPAGPSTDIQLDTGKLSDADDTLLKVIGWGTTSSGGSVSDVLLEVKVPVYNVDKCKKAYTTLDGASQFCAGFPEGGKDSCQADSGGPIFTEVNNTPILVGVVSWGRGCAFKGYPGVYTRTSAVFDFINQNL